MKEYKICILKQSFYEKYPVDIYKEILRKGDKRPYLVFLVKIDEKMFAIPFRSNINHKYQFKINNERGNNEGLDYTKAVIVEESDVGRPAFLRTGTYPQISNNIKIIKKEFVHFLNKYNEISSLNKLNRTENKILQMSTLKYFLKSNK